MPFRQDLSTVFARKSAELEFRDPGSGEFHVVHENVELIADRLELQLIGPGHNWRVALKSAKQADDLDRTGDNVREEKTGDRTTVKAATLRLRLKAP